VTAAASKTTLVIAAVRPSHPNIRVIEAAVDLAIQNGADVLVIGTVETIVYDCPDVVFADLAALEAIQAALFATCVELLWNVPVQWSVHVVWGHLATTINQLGERIDVVGVVLGAGRGGRLARLRRRVLPGLHARLRHAPTLVIAGTSSIN
jgi:nucleotide-binding universal stress UspA family protein